MIWKYNLTEMVVMCSIRSASAFPKLFEQEIRVDFEKLILYNGIKGRFSHDIKEEKEC